jgi:hypothetical protein
MGLKKLGRTMRSTSNLLESNPNNFRKKFAQDAGMTAANAAFMYSGAGMTTAAITGKDFDDLVGYDYQTELGKSGDRASDTYASGVATVAPIAAGIGVTAATGNPQAGMMTMQGVQGAQGLYGSIDGRETQSAIDPDSAMATQSALNTAGNMGMQMMADGGPIKPRTGGSNNMKAEFLKMAGVSTDKDFYQKYPTEESFFKAYPKAMQMAYGGNLSASNAFHTMPDGTIMPGASHAQLAGGGPIKPRTEEDPVKPYVTYDLYDPRIQQYNDSLILHNTFKGDIDKLKNTKTLGEWRDITGDFPHTIPGSPEDKKAFAAYQRLRTVNPDYGPTNTYEKRYGNGSSSVANEFAAPKQPVQVNKLPINSLRNSQSNEVPELNHPQWYRMKDEKVMGTNGKWVNVLDYMKQKGLNEEQMIKFFPDLKNKFASGGPITKSGYQPVGVRPSSRNGDGSYSNEVSIGVNIDGEELLIPSYWDGQRHSTEDSINQYKKTGEHLGKFGSVEDADRGAKLREYMNNHVHPYSKSYATGGQLTEFEGGGSHEANPNGGIPQGQQALVEEGETKMNAQDYIFSDRILVPEDVLSELTLDKKWANKTFADISKAITKKFDPHGNRETDSVTQSGIQRQLERLMQAQEAFKAEMVPPTTSPQQQAPMQQQMPQMSYGGKIKYFGGGYDPDSPNNSFENYSPPTTLKDIERRLARANADNSATAFKNGNPNALPAYVPDDEYGSIPMGDMYNASMTGASMFNSARNIRDLKNNKPTPKNLGMFDTNQEFRNPEIDYRSIFRANESAEGRARRDIASNTTNAGDLIASNIALGQNTQGMNAQAYTQADQMQAGIDMQVDQLTYGQNAANRQRQMQVSDWNDADLQIWNNALIESRNTMSNNANKGVKNQYNIDQGKAIEGKSTELKYNKRKRTKK